jgi:diguanylate cyclase (GGDEF)-like protein
VDDETKSLPRSPRNPPSLRRDACLVHIYPTGPNMGTRYAIGAKPLVLGRDPGCDIVVRDASVSRRHACIQQSVEGFRVLDLQSRNGTFVNNEMINLALLKDGDYLRIGNGIYRFLAGDNVELAYHEEIYRLTIIDALTEIHNKRYFLELLTRFLSSSIRHHRPLSLVMLDIDRFKTVNDELGHLCGDYVLRELASCVKTHVRKEDLFARFGGEEFAVVLPETTLAGAREMAEQLRKRVEAHHFAFEERTVSVTISLGVASTTGESPLTVDEFIHQADEKLYEAKHAGRNCVMG